MHSSEANLGTKWRCHICTVAHFGAKCQLGQMHCHILQRLGVERGSGGVPCIAELCWCTLPYPRHGDFPISECEPPQQPTRALIADARHPNNSPGPHPKEGWMVSSVAGCSALPADVSHLPVLNLWRNGWQHQAHTKHISSYSS